MDGQDLMPLTAIEPLLMNQGPLFISSFLKGSGLLTSGSIQRLIEAYVISGDLASLSMGPCCPTLSYLIFFK